MHGPALPVARVRDQHGCSKAGNHTKVIALSSDMNGPWPVHGEDDMFP